MGIRGCRFGVKGELETAASVTFVRVAWEGEWMQTGQSTVSS